MNPSDISSSMDKLAMEFREGATYTGGTALVPVNHNRNEPIPSALDIVALTTVTGEGIRLAGAWLPGSVDLGQRRAGGQTGPRGNEMYLKHETKYLYKLTNGSTETNEIAITLYWFETKEG